jgi:ferredoxin
MNARAYRRARILIGGLVLAACVLVFADVRHWLGADAVRGLLWPQFAPSVSGLLAGAGWLAAGCVVVLLLTLCFGRVYCAMLCPLGVLMDLSARLAGRTGKKRRLPYRSGRPGLRVAAVAVCVLGLVAGSAVPLALLDPYSLFGKIAGGLLRPLAGLANHGFAALSWTTPVKVSPVAWATSGMALGLLVLVAGSAITRGRLWCNSACPVGAVLGFVSKFAWFRLQIADSACVACSMCERVCPAQCIDFRNHRIDHSRCVMCLDCVSSCKRSGIHFQSAWKKRRRAPTAENIPPPLPAVPRRAVLGSLAAWPVAALAAAPAVPPSHRNRRAVLPPGAGSLARFRNLCTACQLCVTNCPDQVLRPSLTRHGLAGFLQPYQDFDISFCSYNCSNCSQVCPTGAIQPITIEQRRLVRTGVAEFLPDLCVVKTKGTSCGACNEHCPTQAVHMVPWEKGLTLPQVEPDLCIGCGGCEYICPVRPHRAIIVKGLAVHERARAVVLGQENTVREVEEEFPF